MICASQPTSGRDLPCASTHRAIAFKSMSIGSEIPSLVNSSSAGRMRPTSVFEISIFVDQSQPYARFQKAVQVFLCFDLLVPRRDGHLICIRRPLLYGRHPLPLTCHV